MICLRGKQSDHHHHHHHQRRMVMTPEHNKLEREDIKAFPPHGFAV
jgi:hypothetical protein